MHLNIFINNSYNTHFPDTFYDLIRYKIQLFSVNIQENFKRIQNNTQLIINYLNQV